jgi:TatD DNase family protein
MKKCFFDSHAHLDGAKYQTDLDAVLTRAEAAGVTHLVCIGASNNLEANYPTLELAKKHQNIFATVGIHPHDAGIVNDETLKEIESLSHREKVVAIGETGLDYFYDRSPREEQIAAFREFVRLARARQLPIVVHTRDAEEDTISVLDSEGARDVGGIIHCFTGTERLAEAALELDFHISFSGILTFANAGPLRAIARELPRERVLVETDCPYLTPAPHRGTRNEPAFVIHVAEKLAELWGCSLEEVKAVTGGNAARLFGIDTA